MSYACCPGPSLAISAQFTLEMCVVARNRKKITKNSFLEGSRSSMLINLKSLSPVISSMSVPICNRFYTIRANTAK